MKNLYTLLFIFLFASVMYGQPSWINQTTGTVTNLHSIHFGDLNHGWSVGEGGKIITTINAGKNWTAQTSGVTTDLNGVYFVDTLKGWAVGNVGTILITTDGGATWTAQTSGTTQTLWDVAFANDMVGWAVGLNDVILRTDNGGTTWTDQTCAVLPNLMDISVIDANTAFACGYSGSSIGRVIKTSDGGANWTSLSPGTATLNGVFFLNDQEGFAVGNSGMIIHTTNAGANWDIQSSGTSEILTSVFFINDTIGWASGMNGTLLYTENAGTDWEIIDVLLNINLRKLFFISPYRGWLCGNGGRIKYSRVSEEICLVTVDSLTQKNKIIWERILGQKTSYYNVYRYSVGANYQVIGTVPFDNMSEYLDVTSTPETNANRYKISAVDSIGIESDLSPFHETMNLMVAQGALQTTIILSWNEYKDESGRFLPSAYAIFRGTSPSNLLSYQLLPGINISYNDLNVTGNQYYMVSVVKDSPCYPTSSAKEVGGPYSSSFSNMEDNLMGIVAEMFNFYGHIQVDPNPISTSATLTINNFQGSIDGSQWQLYDITGKLVRTDLFTSAQTEYNKGTAKITISRGDLLPGIYFVELKAEKTYRGKLVVE
ncbi:MAG: hypothetical protein CVU05_13665 [Bacteroidetes bacterium HGW-Bacteroidetes-21]|nr:MAG: hypothetical protein CVU05_13665 [Bacteroidetes bacterium HGW-Bacteroidetes-21]